jgi:hypothetical protein
MNQDDYESRKLFAVGVDFALSKKDSANRTSFTVGGKCGRNLIHIVDEHVGRWDTLEIVEKFFEIDNRWHPKVFYVEGGKEWLAIKPILDKEMQQRDQWLIFEVLNPRTDKAIRGRVFQKKHRAGACRFDKKASWYANYEAELLSFTGVTDAKADDQFDSTATLHNGFELGNEVDEDEDFVTDEEWEEEHESRTARGSASLTCTGY